MVQIPKSASNVSRKALADFGITTLVRAPVASTEVPLQQSRLRIGTRGSALALAQAHEVQRRLAAAHGRAEASIEVVVIKTTGDRIQDRPLSEAGGKGLFTKEIEEALLDGSIDLAVHSMKDMPTALPEGLAITSMLPREDVRDAFISAKWPSIDALPQGAVVGTSSLRRQAQVRRMRPDLQVVMLSRQCRYAAAQARGRRRRCDAAGGGGIEPPRSRGPHHRADPARRHAAGGGAGRDRHREPLRRSSVRPACSQPLNDAATSLCVTAERAFLARLEGSCRTPIAGLGQLEAKCFHVPR